MFLRYKSFAGPRARLVACTFAFESIASLGTRRQGSTALTLRGLDLVFQLGLLVFWGVVLRLVARKRHKLRQARYGTTQARTDPPTRGRGFAVLPIPRLDPQAAAYVRCGMGQFKSENPPTTVRLSALQH